jgi:hypothetical protein
MGAELNENDPANNGVDLSALDDRGLFVIGHARSGTTVLQNALNASPAIYLFNEANFHCDGGAPGFGARFNSWHRALGNQPSKGTYCPAVLAVDGGWADYLRQLSCYHRRVGEKLAISPIGKWVQGAALMDFMARHFYRSHFIFCFRSPIAVMTSMLRFAECGNEPISDPSFVMIGYLSVVRLYITMARVFPNVHVVFHEEATEALFAALGGKLRIDLSHATSYYRGDCVIPHRQVMLEKPLDEKLHELNQLYENLRESSQLGIFLPQAEQNDRNPSPSHATPVGRLFSTANLLLRDLGAEGL